jgi:hypothetical protein
MTIPRVDSNQTFASNANNASSIPSFKTASAFQASTLRSLSLEQASADAAKKEEKPAEQPFYTRAYESVKNAFSTFWNWLKNLVCCSSSDPTLAKDVETLQKLSKRGFICFRYVLDDKPSVADFLSPCYSLPITMEENTYDGWFLAGLAHYIKNNPDTFKDEVEPLKVVAGYKASDLQKILKDQDENNPIFKMLAKIPVKELDLSVAKVVETMCQAHPGLKERLLATGDASLYYTYSSEEPADSLVKARVALGGKDAKADGAQAFMAAHAAAKTAGTLDAFWRNE